MAGPQAGDGEAYLKAKLDEMTAALHAQDGDRLKALLMHLAAEGDPTIGNQLLAGLVEVAMGDIAAGVRAGDPDYIAAAYRLLTN